MMALRMHLRCCSCIYSNEYWIRPCLSLSSSADNSCCCCWRRRQSCTMSFVVRVRCLSCVVYLSLLLWCCWCCCMVRAFVTTLCAFHQVLIYNKTSTTTTLMRFLHHQHGRHRHHHHRRLGLGLGERYIQQTEGSTNIPYIQHTTRIGTRGTSARRGGMRGGGGWGEGRPRHDSRRRGRKRTLIAFWYVGWAKWMECLLEISVCVECVCGLWLPLCPNAHLNSIEEHSKQAYIYISSYLSHLLYTNFNHHWITLRVIYYTKASLLVLAWRFVPRALFLSMCVCSVPWRFAAASRSPPPLPPFLPL